MKVYSLNDDNGTLVLLDEDIFKTVDLCDCYDRFGQTNGCYNSACYALYNSGSDAQKDCETAILEKFDIFEKISKCKNL